MKSPPPPHPPVSRCGKVRVEHLVMNHNFGYGTRQDFQIAVVWVGRRWEAGETRPGNGWGLVRVPSVLFFLSSAPSCSTVWPSIWENKVLKWLLNQTASYVPPAFPKNVPGVERKPLLLLLLLDCHFIAGHSKSSPDGQVACSCSFSWPITVGVKI